MGVSIRRNTISAIENLNLSYEIPASSIQVFWNLKNYYINFSYILSLIYGEIKIPNFIKPLKNHSLKSCNWGRYRKYCMNILTNIKSFYKKKKHKLAFKV